MNCRPGDLARTVNMPSALSTANDRIVRCASACVIGGEPGWNLAEPVNFVMVETSRAPSGQILWIGELAAFDQIQDKYLRPIRGVPGEDEILRIVGRPADLPAPAVIAESAL